MILITALIMMALQSVQLNTNAVNPQYSNEEFQTNEFDTPPKGIRCDYPIYPRSIVRSSTDANATVRYTVSSEGRATYSELIESTPEAFGRHIAAALKFCKYKPAMKDGKPVEATITVTFDLKHGV